MTDGWGWRDEQPPKADPLRWALHKGARHATCRIVPHALGVELIVEVDDDPMLTQLHRREVDADLHAATLEDDFTAKGWVAEGQGP